MLNTSVPAGPAHYFLLLLLFILPVADVWSQTSGSISLVSDYRFRGHSMNWGRPSAQAGIAYDDAAGWYAGGLLSKVNAYGDDDTQLVGYAGYAGSLTPDLHWEAGMLRSSYIRYDEYRYTEAYAGLNLRNFGARLYVSPNYPGNYRHTAYLEINGAYPLNERLTITGHAGMLQPFGNSEYGIQAGSQYDTRFGLKTRLSDWSIQIEHAAAGGAENHHAYPGDASAPAVILTVSREF